MNSTTLMELVNKANRKQLQMLAKANGIKGNLASDAIRQELLKLIPSQNKDDEYWEYLNRTRPLSKEEIAAKRKANEEAHWDYLMRTAPSPTKKEKAIAKRKANEEAHWDYLMNNK